MADQKQEGRESGDKGSQPSGSQTGTGDPGRTPGKAEGDEQTADEDLQRQSQ